jgi:hypothetical protein
VPTNFHVDYGSHKRRIVSTATPVCEDVALHPLKAGKTSTSSGLCALSNPIPKEPNPTADQNTISGSCELFGGEITFNLLDALGQSFYLDLHFTGNPTLTFTGHVKKRIDGQTGKVVGEAVAVPLFDNPGIPTLNSCLQNTVTLFTIVAGSLTFEAT